MSGGNEKSRHYISAGYTDDQGVFYGVDFKKYQLRANVDQKINNWLNAGVRINGAYTKTDDVPMQSLYYANPLFGGQIIAPWSPLYNSEENLIWIYLKTETPILGPTQPTMINGKSRIILTAPYFWK